MKRYTELFTSDETARLKIVELYAQENNQQSGLPTA